MATVVAVTIICDVPQCTEDESEHPGSTVKAARQLAQDDGWHVSGGKDIGPGCWADGWRYGRDGWTVG